MAMMQDLEKKQTQTLHLLEQIKTAYSEKRVNKLHFRY